MKKTKVHQKLIAMLLATVVLLTSVPLAFWGLGQKNASAMNTASKEDRRIASEISNETGFSIEEVFNYKLPGRSWNEVLNILKTTSRLGDTAAKKERDSTLLNSGLDETFIQQLKNEGFKEQEITEAKMLGERVLLQLRDIAEDGDEPGVIVEVPNPGISNGTDKKEDLTVYKELLNKIDIQKAVYFMLRLKSDLGSYEKVFNEYLYSIQMDIDLNEYIKDKKSYLSKIDKKKKESVDQNIITLANIEEKSVEMLQKSSLNNSGEVLAPEKDSPKRSNEASDVKSPLPDVPKVKAEDVKPKNPTDEVMNEIKEINPVKN